LWKKLLAVLLCLALLSAYAVRIPDIIKSLGSSATFSVSGMRDYAEAFAVLDLANRERAKESLPALQMDADMLEAAMLRAAETHIYWSHTRPGGGGSSTASPFGNSTYGENIAVGQLDAAAVMAGWMNSPGHRENIMKADYSVIGIGCFYQGDVRYWVQVFGDKPVVAVPPPVNTVVSTPVRVLKENYYLKLFAQPEGTTLRYVLGINTRESWPTGSYTVIDADCLDFSSSDTTVASVDAAGLLTKHSAGSATITATRKAGIIMCSGK